jgi:CRISPR-associated protein Cmr4
MTTRILYLFTRTPLHVGAGSSVGAIDQPIQRERHTGFPIIPASSLKGSFADQWPNTVKVADGSEKPLAKDGKSVRLTVLNGGQKTIVDEAADSAWLFGSDTTDLPFAGSLLFSEARVLAFPIRSAKGSYAWITCPLMLQRAKRDGVLKASIPPEPTDNQAIFKEAGPLALGADKRQVVLEEYCFAHSGSYPEQLAKELAGLVNDEIWKSISDTLVVLSNGMMSHFVTTACEVAQHVRISDETGTAEGTGLFNQENVPSETLFYSLLNATAGRGEHFKSKTAEQALDEFKEKVANVKVFQFGGDASTGLGFCSITVEDRKGT